MIFLYILSFANALLYKPIFISGANSQIGRRVVHKLDNFNIPTRCVIRNYDKSHFLFKNTKHAEFIEGNVLDPIFLEHIMNGCHMSINLHSSIINSNPTNSHLFLNKFDHPYYVNYMSMNYILDSCKTNNINKIIRTTHIATSFKNFNPISLFLDTFYSQNINWHRKGEIAIIDSDIDHTIIRSKLTNIDSYKNVKIEENGKFNENIDYDNLANIIIQSAFPELDILYNSISIPYNFSNSIISCAGYN